MPRAIKLEKDLVAAGVLEIAEFTAHNGENGNYKLNMEKVLNPDSPHQELARTVAKTLTKKIKPLKPEIIIPIPDGANFLGELVGRQLGVRVISLAWRDKEARELEYVDQRGRIVVCWAERIALIDDVFRTGSSFEEALNFAELLNKQVIGGVAWDRSDPNLSKNLPVEAAVTKYLPMRVDV